MNTNTPTNQEQIAAMVTGVWPSPHQAFARDPQSKLTFTLAELRKYLIERPDLVGQYLRRWESVKNSADINAIWAEDNRFKVAWLGFGGHRHLVKEFSDPTDAVVEHISRLSGILK